jgi:hypothetical protein
MARDQATVEANKVDAPPPVTPEADAPTAGAAYEVIHAQVQDRRKEMDAQLHIRSTERSKTLGDTPMETKIDNVARGMLPGVDGARDMQFASIEGNMRTSITSAEYKAWGVNEDTHTIEFLGSEDYYKFHQLPDLTAQALRRVEGTFIVHDEQGERIQEGLQIAIAVPRDRKEAADRYRDTVRKDQETDAEQKRLREGPYDLSNAAKNRDQVQQEHEDMVAAALAGPGTRFSGIDYDYAMRHMETPEQRAAIAAELRSQGRSVDAQLDALQTAAMDDRIDKALERRGKQFAIGAGFDDAGKVVK